MKTTEEKNIEIARKLYGQNQNVESFERNQQKFSGWVSNGRSLFDLIKKAQESSSFDELDEGWQRAFIGIDEAYRFWQ